MRALFAWMTDAAALYTGSSRIWGKINVGKPRAYRCGPRLSLAGSSSRQVTSHRISVLKITVLFSMVDIVKPMLNFLIILPKGLVRDKSTRHRATVCGGCSLALNSPAIILAWWAVIDRVCTQLDIRLTDTGAMVAKARDIVATYTKVNGPAASKCTSISNPMTDNPAWLK